MTPYEQHEREVARGWEPYPYPSELEGAPLTRHEKRMIAFYLVAVAMAIYCICN